MKLKFLLLTFTFFITLGTLQAQDIHFSLFNMSPLTLNPALTGAYEGTARAGGIYRDQWRGLLGKDDLYTTPSFYVDAPIIRGFRKKDWVGAGFVTYNDLAGSSLLLTNTSLLSLSYHFSLNKEGSTLLTLGLQGGSSQRRFIRGGKIFGDELQSQLNGQPTESKDAGISLETDPKSALDFGAGLMLRTEVDAVSTLEVGLAFQHINQPKYGFGTAQGQGGVDTTRAKKSDAKRPMRTVVHSKYQRNLTEQFSIAPTFLFQTTGGATEIVLQGWGGYQLNDDYKLNGGLGYRFGDAAQLLFGLDFKENLRVAASYDISLSPINEGSYSGGSFEIAAWYIFKIYKKPNVKPALLCPQF